MPWENVRKCQKLRETPILAFLHIFEFVMVSHFPTLVAGCNGPWAKARPTGRDGPVCFYL